jgi:hypothetical protein
MLPLMDPMAQHSVLRACQVNPLAAGGAVVGVMNVGGWRVGTRE